MRRRFRWKVCALALAAPMLMAAQCGFEFYTIPIHVIALSDDDGGRGNEVEPDDVAAQIDVANEIFASAGVQLSFDPASDWEERFDTELNSMQNGVGADWWEAPNQVAARYPGKLVIFLRYGPQSESEPAKNGFAYPPDTGQTIPPKAPLPTENVDFVAFLNKPERYDESPAWLGHEVGHYLGLFHTHPSWSGGLVKMQGYLDALGLSGMDGDGLDDTPPDAAREHYQAYTGQGTCAGNAGYWAFSAASAGGVAWVEPNRHNLMGYFKCADVELSPKQRQIVRDTLQHDFRRHLIEPVCPPDHHRLPASGFQRCVDYWRLKGVWPVSVSASDLGDVTMTSTFQAGAPRWVRHLVRTKAYQDAFDAASADGFRPEQVQGLLVDGEARWNGVWTPIDGEFLSRHGADLATFADDWTLATDKGWQLVDLNVMDDWNASANDVGRFNYTFVDQGSMDFIAHYDMSAADYTTLFWAYDDAGYEVVRFNTYTTVQGKRYAALWHPRKMDYAHEPWQTPAEYQANYDLYAAAGFRLRQLHDYGGLISAIWIRDPRDPRGPQRDPGSGPDPNASTVAP